MCGHCKNIFAPRFDRLAVLGMAKASAAALRAVKPGKAGSWPDLSSGYKYLQLERMAYCVNKDAYRNAVRQASAAQG